MEEPDYKLEVRQQPVYARVAIGKEKDRKPIDPPPIVQLKVSAKKDPMQNFLQNPYLIMSCQLIKANDDDKDTSGPVSNALLGTIVSSLYSLKDTDNSVGGFFVFGDLSVKCEGTYRLEFTLFELKMPDKWCWYLASVRSDPFTVYAQKYFPGMAESTFLTRSFSDQGVRLRLRKDSRSITTRKRNSTVADYSRQYSRHDHTQEVSPASGRGDHHPRSGGGYSDTISPIDRVRGGMQQVGSGAYFDNSPRLGEYSHGPPGGGYPGYGAYDEPRSAKRQRMGVEQPSNGGTHGYENHDFTPYQQAAAAAGHHPRTIPEMPPTSSILPYSSSGYAVTSSAAAVAGLPMPAPYHTMPPRLDTQVGISSHNSQGTGPSSATSTFSPGSRRSPNSGYPYHMGAYSSTPTTLHYQSAPPTAGQHTNGLGLGLDLGGVDDKGQHGHGHTSNGPGL
ncbi:velvet factor-domain-containing protein [Coniochaeta sp. 2T2.1]|nr:velvet factor-domain-containing protein [Coniochaeta sp. 2T2.1]